MIDGYRFFQQKSKDYDFYHAWFDLNTISENKQRGFIELANYDISSGFYKEEINNDYKEPHHSKVKLNVFGGFLMPIISRLYYFSKIFKKTEIIGLFNFIHPSSDKLFYFSMLGKKGLIEHQVLIPHHNVEVYLNEFIALIQKFRPVVPLCHTKIFAQKASGMSFTGEGYCLAFHVPNNEKNMVLMSKVDQLDLKYNCIANVIKDSRLTSKVIQLEYGQLFKKQIRLYDPQRYFSNMVIRRIFGED